MMDLQTLKDKPLSDLSARLKVKSGLFRKEWVQVAVFALDENCCVLKTDIVFMPGDTLEFELVLKMPFENLQVSAITASVTKLRKHCSNFFYLTVFRDIELIDKPMLARIMSNLDRKCALEARRCKKRESNLLIQQVTLAGNLNKSA